MLSRPGPLPSRDGYAYEVKWDGFRPIVSTTGGLRVRSRRGWNMTELVPELADLPPRLVLDGELVVEPSTSRERGRCPRRSQLGHQRTHIWLSSAPSAGLYW